MSDSPRPLIVNINENSLDDGPGIRTVLFFKGCPLRCVWCQNPETQNPDPELLFQPTQCIQCDYCPVLCPMGAANYDLKNRIIQYHRELCHHHFQCVSSCPAEVFVQSGRYYSHEEILKLVKSNRIFYENTGGGLTLSGGEALMFPDYVHKLVTSLHEVGIHVVVETSGFFKWTSKIVAILRLIDIIYFDLKLFDRTQHYQHCGVDNSLILDNFHKILEELPPHLPQDLSDLDWRSAHFNQPLLIPRIPLIPGLTTESTNLIEWAQFLRSNKLQFIDLLPYNPLWCEKSIRLGKSVTYQRTTWMTHEELRDAMKPFEGFTFEKFRVQ